MEDMLKEFVVEALDLSAQVEENLLVLENNPEDLATVNAVFRSFHTIKGGAGFMGLPAMVSACHLTENLFDALRNGQIPVTNFAIEASLQASTFVADQLNELNNGATPEELSPLPKEIESMLVQAIAGETGEEPAAQPAQASIPPPAEPTPAPVAAPSAAPQDGVDWVSLYNAVVPDERQISAEPAPSPGNQADSTADAQVTDNVSENTAPATGEGDAADQGNASTQAVVTETAPKTGGWDGQDRRKQPSSTANKEDSIRIDAVKLDALLEIAGEAAQAANQASVLLEKLRQFAFEDNVTDIIANLMETQSRASRYSTELQHATLSARMQPVGRLFQRFPRLVRELAKELGKNVDLIIEGAETEVDRVVVDSLYDPLVHMLRNSLDHGLETAEEREKTGKPLRGRIMLRAWQEASSVMIEVSDDGRGMNPEKLRNKAIEKGLLSSSAKITDEESYQLVFLPGFSTMEVASNVSGRGVGMDVVKTAVEKHRGTIWIHSQMGEGTRFSIRLPIELSIIPMLLVSTAGAKLGLPMSLVERVVQLPDDFEHVSGQPVFRDQGRPLPVLSMAGVLGYPHEVSEKAGIVIAAPSPYILSVEELDGTAELVIKPLSVIEVTGISGTTRSAEGELVLVVSLSFLLDGCQTSSGMPHSPIM